MPPIKLFFSAMLQYATMGFDFFFSPDCAI